MTSPRSRRLRVTLVGATEMAVEIDPDAITTAEGSGSPLVTELRRADGSGRHRFEVVVDGWRFEAAVEPAHQAALRDKAARAAREHHHSTASVLRAHIPGRVARVWVEVGQQVEQGERLLAIEAMKMENELRAPHAGRVERIAVAVGALVERDTELLTLGGPAPAGGR